MREFVTVKLRCPVCDMEFAADEVHGASHLVRETDFRPVFEGPDPILSHMHSCPGCRYSAYRDGFATEPSDEDELIEPFDDDPKSLARPHGTVPDEEDAADLRRYIKSGELSQGLLDAGQDPFGAVRYLLASRVHEFFQDDEPLVAAHYYLRAAWCARAAADRGLEKRALREVLLRLSNVLESGQNVTDADRLRLAYLAGETARRAGDFGRAVDFFAQVEKEADVDEEEGALLAQLARRQNQLAVTKSDVNAVIPPDLPGRRKGEDPEDDGDDAVDDDDDDGESSLN